MTGPPGVPAVRGKAAILAYFTKDAADFAAAKLVDADGSDSEVQLCGDQAWQWGTYRITDSTGAVVAGGKYLSLFQRRDQQWKIRREIYNSDSSADAPLSIPR